MTSKNRYFSKLNIEWDRTLTSDFLYNNINRDYSVFYRPSNIEGYFSFYPVSEVVTRMVLDSIPGLEELQPYITYGIIEGPPGEGTPHIDTMLNGNKFLCTINFYLEPNNMITKFYSKPHQNVRRIPISELESGFNSEDLQLVDEFTANTNDTYLLNVQEIHSVTNTNDFISQRKILSAKFFNMSYDEVISFFYGKNLVIW